jgi:hypothetical protein
MVDSEFAKYAELLAEPFAPEQVKFRLGGRVYKTEDRQTGEEKHRAQALCYIDARDVMDRLDQVLGSENWQDNYTTYSGTVLCSAGVNVAALTGRDPKTMAQDGWVWKADGAGPTAFEAEKGQISDAFKRAWVRWGINRAAYKLPVCWVDVQGCYEKDGKPKGGKIPQYELERLMHMYENFDFGGAGGPEMGQRGEAQGAPGVGGEARTGTRQPPASRPPQQSEPAPPPPRADQERGSSAPTGRRVTWKMAGRILAISMSRADELRAAGQVDEEFHGYRIVQSLLKEMGLRTASRGAKKDDYIGLLIDEVRKPIYDNFCSAVASWKPRPAQGEEDGGFSEPPKARQREAQPPTQPSETGDEPSADDDYQGPEEDGFGGM